MLFISSAHETEHVYARLVQGNEQSGGAGGGYALGHLFNIM